MNKIQEIEHVLILNNVKYEKFLDKFYINACELSEDNVGCVEDFTIDSSEVIEIYKKYPDYFNILLCADCDGCVDWMPC